MARIQCPYCFEKFSITVFIEDGEQQSFTYDCEICCNPIMVEANWNPDREKFKFYPTKSSGQGE